MKKLCVLIAIILSITTYSQKLEIHKTNGTVESFLLSQIDSITFNATNIIPTEGLMAYYPFNGNANDESGNGHNGIITATTLTSDRFGNPNSAYSFNGVSSYVSIPNGINLSNTSFTIAFWSKCNVLGALYNTAIGQGTSSVQNNQLHIAYRDVAMQYRLTFDFFDNGINVPSQYSDLLLHFWTCSYDAVSKSRKVYRDAILVASDISSSDFLGSGPFLIGTGIVGSTSYFNGTIDDVFIYSRALSESEILQIYHVGGWAK